MFLACQLKEIQRCYVVYCFFFVGCDQYHWWQWHASPVLTNLLCQECGRGPACGVRDSTHHSDGPWHHPGDTDSDNF